MFGGSVARGNKPARPGEQPKDGAPPERRAPTVVNHHVGDERRRESGAGSDAGEDPAIGYATLANWNPARHKLIGCWIDNRLARAEQKTNGDKQKESAPRAGGNQGR